MMEKQKIAIESLLGLARLLGLAAEDASNLGIQLSPSTWETATGELGKWFSLRCGMERG